MPEPIPVPRALLDTFLQSGVQMGQFLRGHLPIMDIGVRADPPDDAPGGIANGNGFRQEPAVGPVARSTEPDLAFEDRSILQSLPPGLKHNRMIVRVDDALPCAVSEIIESGAQVFGKASVGPLDRSVRTGFPHLMGNGLDQSPERLLAGAQRLFGSLPFGNIPIETDDAARNRTGRSSSHRSFPKPR